VQHSSGVAASISFWVGVITGVLLLIDATLTEAQRKKLRESIEAAWVWLDDQRAERFYRPIRNYKVQLIAAAAMHLFYVFGVFGDLSFRLGSASLPWAQLLGVLASASLFAWWGIPLTVKWITGAASIPRALGRGWVVSLVACFPFYIMNAYPITAASNDPIDAVHWFFFSNETRFYRGLYIPFLHLFSS
jgi:hypothetical protein